MRTEPKCSPVSSPWAVVESYCCNDAMRRTNLMTPDGRWCGRRHGRSAAAVRWAVQTRCRVAQTGRCRSTSASTSRLATCYRRRSSRPTYTPCKPVAEAQVRHQRLPPTTHHQRAECPARIYKSDLNAWTERDDELHCASCTALAASLL